MHELPIVREVLKIAVEHAEKNQGNKIISIHLGVGELHDLVEDWMQRYLEYAAKGTIAEGAVLKVKNYPVLCQCSECKEHFTLNIRTATEVICPVCANEEYFLISGKEFLIERIEVI